jgi:hypothetical protein
MEKAVWGRKGMREESCARGPRPRLPRGPDRPTAARRAAHAARTVVGAAPPRPPPPSAQPPPPPPGPYTPGAAARAGGPSSTPLARALALSAAGKHRKHCRCAGGGAAKRQRARRGAMSDGLLVRPPGGHGPVERPPGRAGRPGGTQRGRGAVPRRGRGVRAPARRACARRRVDAGGLSPAGDDGGRGFDAAPPPAVCTAKATRPRRPAARCWPPTVRPTRPGGRPRRGAWPAPAPPGGDCSAPTHPRPWVACACSHHAAPIRVRQAAGARPGRHARPHRPNPPTRRLPPWPLRLASLGASRAGAARAAAGPLPHVHPTSRAAHLCQPRRCGDPFVPGGRAGRLRAAAPRSAPPPSNASRRARDGAGYCATRPPAAPPPQVPGPLRPRPPPGLGRPPGAPGAARAGPAPPGAAAPAHSSRRTQRPGRAASNRGG